MRRRDRRRWLHSEREEEWREEPRFGRGDRSGYGDVDRREREPRRRSDVEPHRRRGFVHPDEREWRDESYESPGFRRGGAGEARFIGPPVESGYGPDWGELGGRGIDEDHPDPARLRRPHGPEGWIYGGLGYRPEPPGAFQGVAPRTYRRSDRAIHEDVCTWLTEDEWIDATDVEVEVRDSVVHLRGTVSDRAAKRRADDIAHAVPGVHDVMNELRLAHRRPELGKEARERLEPSNGEGRR